MTNVHNEPGEAGAVTPSADSRAQERQLRVSSPEVNVVREALSDYANMAWHEWQHKDADKAALAALDSLLAYIKQLEDEVREWRDDAELKQSARIKQLEEERDAAQAHAPPKVVEWLQMVKCAEAAEARVEQLEGERDAAREVSATLKAAEYSKENERLREAIIAHIDPSVSHGRHQHDVLRAALAARTEELDPSRRFEDRWPT